MMTKKVAQKPLKCKTELSVPKQYNVVQYIRFWTGNAIAESKGGSFNMDLYVRYLTIKSKL